MKWLFVLLASCSCPQPPPPATPATTTPPPTPTQPAPPAGPGIGENCGANDACGTGTCVSYYGIAGARGPQFKTCEIKCDTDATCPGGRACNTIADGPGRVCR